MMIYLIIGAIGFLIVIGLQYLATQDTNQTYQRLAILQGERDRVKQRREVARVKRARALQEEEEGKRRIGALQDEITSLTGELETIGQTIPSVDNSRIVDNLKRELELKKSIRGGRRRAGGP